MWTWGTNFDNILLFEFRLNEFSKRGKSNEKVCLYGGIKYFKESDKSSQSSPGIPFFILHKPTYLAVQKKNVFFRFAVRPIIIISKHWW